MDSGVYRSAATTVACANIFVGPFAPIVIGIFDLRRAQAQQEALSDFYGEQCKIIANVLTITMSFNSLTDYII